MGASIDVSRLPKKVLTVVSSPEECFCGVSIYAVRKGNRDSSWIASIRPSKVLEYIHYVAPY